MSNRAVASPAAPSVIRSFASRRPVAAFLVIVFSVAYPVMSLLALVQHQVIPGRALLERLPVPVDELSGLLLTMFALFPAAVYVTWASEGRPGVVRLLRRIGRWRFHPAWWLMIVVPLPVLTIGLGLVLGDTPQSVDPLRVLLTQLPLLLANLLLVNLWEETAWTGVMQVRLETRHNLFVAAALTAVPFGFVHWPLAFFGTGSLTSILWALPAYIALGLFVRPLFGLTMRATGNSLLAVALMHSFVNRTQNPNGIAADFLVGENYTLGVLIALVVLTTIVTLVIRRTAGPIGQRRGNRNNTAHPRTGGM